MSEFDLEIQMESEEYDLDIQIANNLNDFAGIDGGDPDTIFDSGINGGGP